VLARGPFFWVIARVRQDSVQRPPPFQPPPWMGGPRWRHHGSGLDRRDRDDAAGPAGNARALVRRLWWPRRVCPRILHRSITPKSPGAATGADTAIGVCERLVGAPANHL